MKLKKVLIASNNLDIGGMEKSLIEILKNINYEKYSVTLVLEKKQGKLLNEVPKQVKIIEYKISTKKNVFIRKFINMMKFFVFQFKIKNKFDFSCCYATYSLICGKIALTASKNNLLYVHSNYYEYFKKNANAIIEWSNSLKFSEFKRIAFVSNEAMHGLISVLPQYKDKFILLGNLFNDKYVKVKSIEKKIDRPKNKKIFVFVGRLEEESKRITRMIETFRIIKEKNDMFELWVIGDGKDRNLYIDLIKKYDLENNIKLLGEKTNPYPYYVAADYILIFSDFEGFPVVYNEAFCLDKPLITTINLSDEFINIEKSNSILIPKDAYLSSKIILEKVFNGTDKKIKIDVDYNVINKSRMETLEKIISEG